MCPPHGGQPHRSNAQKDREGKEADGDEQESENHSPRSDAFQILVIDHVIFLRVVRKKDVGERRGRRNSVNYLG
jgi:hypothetical protein